jgi:hypothetical protein
MAKPETLQCDAGTELWHSFEIGMTDIRMAPIDAVLLAADALCTPRDRRFGPQCSIE